MPSSRYRRVHWSICTTSKQAVINWDVLERTQLAETATPTSASLLCPSSQIAPQIQVCCTRRISLLQPGSHPLPALTASLYAVNFLTKSTSSRRARSSRQSVRKRWQGHAEEIKHSTRGLETSRSVSECCEVRIRTQYCADRNWWPRIPAPRSTDRFRAFGPTNTNTVEQVVSSGFASRAAFSLRQWTGYSRAFCSVSTSRQMLNILPRPRPFHL